MKTNKKKSNLDEMQEQKLLRIEHNGCWFAFWALAAALSIQLFLGGEDMMRAMAGEWIIFMCLGVYMAGACIKNGIWDRKLKPGFKTNAIISLIAGLAVGVFGFVRSYVQYDKFAGSVAAGIFQFMNTFVLCLLVLSVTGWLYKKRVQKLENDDPADNE